MNRNRSFPAGGYGDSHLALETYNRRMERKVFWGVFTVLGIAADFVLPLWWALFASIPLVFISWWIAYRSGWFD